MATVSTENNLVNRDHPGVAFEELRLCYEPFPIGICDEFVNPSFYHELLDTWPPADLFRFMPNLGKKYSLSEANHGEAYRDYCRATRPWKLFQQMVKDTGFVEYVLATLRARNVNVGYDARQLTSRFEFSMLSGDGGHIVPHTDAPAKVVTIVVYFLEPGDWDAAWGGGTAILRANSTDRTFNRINLAMPFNEVEQLHDVPFTPNTGLLFVKTFNSLHAVYPLRAPGHQFRRSVTINLELPEHPTAKYLNDCSADAKRFEMQ